MSRMKKAKKQARAEKLHDPQPEAYLLLDN